MCCCDSDVLICVSLCGDVGEFLFELYADPVPNDRNAESFAEAAESLRTLTDGR